MTRMLSGITHTSTATVRNEYNVRSYGAIGNGTADDTQAIQNALDAAFAAGGGVVTIPTGQYKIGSGTPSLLPLLIKDGVHIDSDPNAEILNYEVIPGGSGANVMVKNGTASATAGGYTGNGNITIRGGTWNFRGDVNTSWASIMVFGHGENITLDNIIFKNVRSAHAIELSACKTVRVNNCTFKGFKNTHNWKMQNVRVATTANGVLATAFANGQTIDGQVLATGDRILLKNQTLQLENGIYTVNATGVPTRATDADTTAELHDAAVSTTSGTANAGIEFLQTTANPTVGVSNIVWASTTDPDRRESEAIQLDLARSGLGGLPPDDYTCCLDVIVSNCYFGPSLECTSWGRGVGSHSAAIGVWHTNMKILGNTFENLLFVAVRAYNWQQAIIDTNILTNCGTGFEVRPPTVGQSPSDTLNTSGVEQSVSQALVDIRIANNIIRSTNQVLTGYHPIRVVGYSTGHITNVNVIGNTIDGVAAAGTDGVYIEYCDDATVTGNIVDSAYQSGIKAKTCAGLTMVGNKITTTISHYGLFFDTCTDSLVEGNSVTNTARAAIYVSAGSQIDIVNNQVKGAGRLTDATYNAINLDTSATGCRISYNRVRKYGSDNEALNAISTSSNCSSFTILDNDCNDLPLSIASTLPTGNRIFARATSTTAVGTGATAITGLTLPLGLGTWRFWAWVPGVNVSATAITLTVSPSSGPTMSSCYYHIARSLATSTDVSHKTAFNSASAGTSPIATLFQVEGTCTVTTAGTYSISMTRTGGTSWTAQIGAYIFAERVS